MLKKFHFTKSTLVILFAYSLALVLWLLLDYFFFNSLFSHLSTDKITDLSKTLIQSTGILVGLVVAAGFFYISRVDELGVSVLSKAYGLLEKIEIAIMKRKKTTKILEECKIQLASLSGNLNSSEILRKTSLEEKVNELEKAFEKTDQALKKLKDLDVGLLLKKFQNLEKLAIGEFGVDVAMFLASIIVAIASYVSLNGRLLGASFDLLFFGIAVLFLVWDVFYDMSTMARDFFKFILEFKAELRKTLMRDTEHWNELDELVNEIKEACAKTKS